MSPTKLESKIQYWENLKAKLNKFNKSESLEDRPDALNTFADTCGIELFIRKLTVQDLDIVCIKCIDFLTLITSMMQDFIYFRIHLRWSTF